MADLRQALRELVDHPPVPPTSVEEVAVRGRRFARRRRAQRGLATVLSLAVLGAGGLVVARQDTDPDVIADQADAEVSYTDDVGDAIGPGPASAAYDIVSWTWAPVAGADDQQPRDYTVSITIAGAVDEEWGYAATADLRSRDADEPCQIHHALDPGTTAFADVFCGSTTDGTRRHAGRVEGGPVRSTPTADGGTVLTATFDVSTLPPEAVGQAFVDLWASTFDADPETAGPQIWLDDARSSLTYRP